ncbi:MAG TPA: SGNH/GDSL hydrolase family protein [Roseimicrobium sp.]|nr:SGNH/GDSL hydrolase family protein [Roseimicrobium sp.]
MHTDSTARLRRVSLPSWTPIAFALALGAIQGFAAPAPVTVSGDWDLKVEGTILKVTPPAPVDITAEKHDVVPIYNPKAGGWARGLKLKTLVAQETTTPFLLDPSTVVVRAGADASSDKFELGKDYQLEPSWGTLGRLEGGRIGEKQPIYISYRYTPLRLDAVVKTASGKIEVRQGKPVGASPAILPVAKDEERLANLWLPGPVAKLSPDHIFTSTETSYPEAAKPSPTMAEKRIPKAMAKLKSGEPLRILAWGDSVTEATYLPDYTKNRWQVQFVERLQKRFPTAKIELVTEAWGGRNTSSYLNEPPGSIHNYKEKVLGAKPDLVISEFINDAGLKPEQVEERYGKLLADFQSIGAEWIILTPHYSRPDWMGLKRERDIDEDPRPYVTGLRVFAEKHSIALADASLRWGRLWRQGIPYTILLSNSINHPDPRGQKIFGDALMEIFP